MGCVILFACRERACASTQPVEVAGLALTFDHRVCTGGAAEGFIRSVADAIENPTSLLTEI